MKIFVLNGFRACWLGRNGQTKSTFQADFAGSGMCQCERFRRKLHVSWPCCSWNSKVPIFVFELLETDVFKESSQPCQEPHLSNSSAHECRGKCSKCSQFRLCLLLYAVGLTKMLTFFQAPLCPEGIWSHLELGQFGAQRTVETLFFWDHRNARFAAADSNKNPRPSLRCLMQRCEEDAFFGTKSVAIPVLFQHTCWWFRNPKANHPGCIKPL